MTINTSKKLDPRMFLPQDTGLRGKDLWLAIRKEIGADEDAWNQGSWARRSMAGLDYDHSVGEYVETLPTMIGALGTEVVVPTCGTAFCAAGWACQLIGDPAAFPVGDSSTSFTLSGAMIEDAALKALEISTRQATELFAGDNSLERLDELAAWIWDGAAHPGEQYDAVDDDHDDEDEDPCGCSACQS